MPKGNNQYSNFVVGDTKYCPGCKEQKKLSEFPPNKSYALGIESRCRACKAAYMKAHRKANPDQYKAYDRKHKDKVRNDPQHKLDRQNQRLKSKYGISLEIYNKMVADRNNKCDICGMDGSLVRYGKLKVDHDHSTGEIRGLLCDKCNFAIGLLNDNPTLIGKVLEYLR